MTTPVVNRVRLARLRVRGASSLLNPWLLAWVSFLPFTLMRAGTLAEADTFWQIRTGQITIESGRIPTRDTFSWTVHGYAWKLNSWLFNVLLAAAYRGAGLPGVALESTVIVAMIGGVVLFMARRAGASPAVAALLLWAAVPLLAGYLSARPQLIDYLAVLALVALLSHIFSGFQPRRTLALIAVLMLAWVNLHTGALLGVGITGVAAALAWAFRETRPRAPLCSAALLVAMTVCVINPYGLDLIAQSSNVMRASSGIITEWRHPDLGNPLQMIILAAGAFALTQAVRSRDRPFTAALSTSAVGAVTAIRFLPILLLLSLPVLAKFASRDQVLRYIQSRRAMLAQGALVCISATLVLGTSALFHLGRPAPGIYPVAALRAIPHGCRVFTTDLIGGLLILKRPDTLVSLDSRNDLYGRRRDLMAIRVLRGEGNVQQELAGADCVLVPPTSGLARQLNESPGWQRRSSEAAAVLYVRSG